MPSWLVEILVVLAHSKRTQLAIWLGLISFIVISVIGNYLVSHLEFQGFLAPFTNVIQESFFARYDKAAWSSLGAFLLLALKFYRKDRRRLLTL